MNKKEYLILAPEGEHEYNVIVEETDKGTSYSIHASHGAQWVESEKGKLQLSMLDDGNKVTFNCNLKSVDYSLYFCLRALTAIEHAIDEPNISKYSVVEKKTLTVL